MTTIGRVERRRCRTTTPHGPMSRRYPPVPIYVRPVTIIATTVGCAVGVVAAFYAGAALAYSLTTRALGDRPPFTRKEPAL